MRFVVIPLRYSRLAEYIVVVFIGTKKIRYVYIWHVKTVKKWHCTRIYVDYISVCPILGLSAKMKREVSSRDEFDDDTNLRTTSSPQATLPKQINCHLCYDTHYRRHLHHDKRSSRNEMPDLPASAFLLCSSNIGYIVHTPPPQPTPPPPPPPSTVTCCCSSCCSTFR